MASAAEMIQSAQAKQQAAIQTAIDAQVTSGKTAEQERVENSTAAGLYGTEAGDTASATQDIIARRKAQLEQTDPASTYLKQSSNRRKQQARAAAGPKQLTQNQERQITREGESDIAKALYSTQNQNLSQYQSLIGNIASNASSMYLSNKAIDAGAKEVSIPSQSSSITVICSELYSQGYMSKEIYAADHNYGVELAKNRPYVLSGYHLWAMPLVNLMKKSKLLTKIVSIPAMAWARNMSGDKNIIGCLISKIGEPICEFIGRVYENQIEKEEV